MSVRTLVVDDSAAMRAVIAHALSRDPEIEVVGTADGTTSARAMIKALNPDVITLDVEMPGMNGLDFLDKIMRLRPMPVVMLSTLTSQGAAATIRALELGAYDCVCKPSVGGVGGTDFPAEALAAIVKAAAVSRAQSRIRTAPTPPQQYQPRADAVIAIGASTGGVEALIELLSGFPANCPPTVIVQHMPPSFTATFAARLDRLTQPIVAEARAGDLLKPGYVYLAPGGSRHLEIGGIDVLRCRLVDAERTSGHRPSADRLFHSVARLQGFATFGAILTGMGSDGAQGLKAMRDAGATTFGQDEASCVVYGMPQVAWQIGAVSAQLPLSRIAPRMLQECRA